MATYIRLELANLVGGLAHPEEAFPLANVYQTVPSRSLLPALVCLDFAAEIAHFCLEQILDIEHEVDLHRWRCLAEGVLHVLREAESYFNRHNFLIG